MQSQLYFRLFLFEKKIPDLSPFPFATSLFFFYNIPPHLPAILIPPSQPHPKRTNKIRSRKTSSHQSLQITRTT